MRMPSSAPPAAAAAAVPQCRNNQLATTGVEVVVKINLLLPPAVVSNLVFMAKSRIQD